MTSIRPGARPLSLERLLATVLVAALQAMSAPLCAQETGTEPGEELRVWLVTAGPGDAVWERYGHNALRVLDTVTGRDVSYNWGIFDFQQVDFIPRFLQGRMLYMMAPFDSERMIAAYGAMNREVVLQELALSPAQRLRLRDLADRNALPENRDYIYQYFLDNCSTRVRDLLDLVLGGQLSRRFASEATGLSYRFHTRRLTRVDPLIYTGMDALLGTPTDAELTTWEEMFVPMSLRDAVREMRVTDEAGRARPFVVSEEVVARSSRPAEPTRPPRWLPFYALLGVGLGITMAATTSRRARDRRGLRYGLWTVSVLWCSGAGVLGTLLVLLLFTDHTFAWWNENLFLFNPLSLALGLLLPLSAVRPRWRGPARSLAIAVAAVAVVGLIWQLFPASVQANAMFFALALPAHLGLAWALYGRTPDPVTK